MKPSLLISVFISAAILCLSSERSCGQNITTIAGCGIGDDSLATKAELVLPIQAAFDNSGNAYIADYFNNVIRKVDAGGVITTFAGNGNFGYSGDGGPATAATFNYIFSVAVDRTGNVFIADEYNNCIRKVNTSGIISTIAGNGIAGYTGDGFAAASAELNSPADVAVDTSGNIYIADMNNSCVREINSSGIISTILATASLSGYPIRIALDNKQNLYVATVGEWNIFKVDTTALITIAGTGFSGFSGDGGPATGATFSAPAGLAVDTAGNVYLSDVDNARIRMVSAATGIITTVIANGTQGYSGDGGPADSAEVSGPEGLSFDPNNNLYIADFGNNRIRRVDHTGTITTFAGQNGLFNDGYNAVNAEFTLPENVATDASGNVYVADFFNNRVRMISAATGITTTVAGDGVAGFGDPFSGDGGPATLAHIYSPSAVAVDHAGNLYICAQDDHRVRMVNTSGIISTIAGNGTPGFGGDGGPATLAELHFPTGVAVDPAGNVYICDNNNQCIRKVNTLGTISTIVGTGVAGFSGEGGIAAAAELNYPVGVTLDGMGNLYISDQGNNRIRKVDTTGIITTVAGNGSPGYSGDGGQAIYAQLYYPLGITADSIGDLFIADGNSQNVRMVNPGGVITTIAGNGTQGFSGDGGLAVLAKLNQPSGVALDMSGNLFIADGGNHRVRKVNISALSVPKAGSAVLPGVVVYPNPTTGNINILNAVNTEFVISDILGNEVRKGTISTPVETLDIGCFAPGVYLLQITGSDGSRRVVKVTKE